MSLRHNEVSTALDYSHLKSLDLWQIFARQAEANPSAEALIHDHLRLHYGDLAERAEKLAAGLHQHGLSKGDRLALIVPNWIEFVVTYLAAARLGAVVVPLNVRYRSHELEFMLRNSNAKIVVTCADFGGFDFIALLKDLKPRLPDLAHIVAVGQAVGGQGIVSWETVLGEGAKLGHLPLTEINPAEDLLAIMYTSGTTSTPKGVMLTHQNIVANALTVAEVLEITAADRFLGAVPFFHIFGMSPTIVSALGVGASVVLLDIYKPEIALGLVERERITIHHGVPTMFILELNHPNFANFDLTSLRTGIIAAAPAPAEIIKRTRLDMGCDIASAYGLTETSPCLTITRFGDDDKTRSETVGRVLPGMEVKIVDDDEVAVANGLVGELICRTPGLMKGYFNMPEATAAAISPDGWFFTGDLATLADDGNIRIVGRKKEMINRGGYKIYPREIEELYYTHPKVQEAAIIGLPDSLLGESSCACIKLRRGQTAEPEEMRDFLRDKVADFKIPDRVVFVDSYPMTSSGKIRKVQLRAELSRM